MSEVHMHECKYEWRTWINRCTDSEEKVWCIIALSGFCGSSPSDLRCRPAITLLITALMEPISSVPGLPSSSAASQCSPPSLWSSLLISHLLYVSVSDLLFVCRISLSIFCFACSLHHFHSRCASGSYTGFRVCLYVCMRVSLYFLWICVTRCVCMLGITIFCRSCIVCFHISTFKSVSNVLGRMKPSQSLLDVCEI